MSERGLCANRELCNGSRAILCVGFVLVCFIGCAVAQEPNTSASLDEGKSLFAQCSACHSLEPDRNGRGPTLHHLFGRKSGTVPGYDYSLAMKRAAIVWRDDTLARFLLDPQRVVAGTTMVFAGIPDAGRVKALIDYLRTATR
jgi:cytochrome c2